MSKEPLDLGLSGQDWSQVGTDDPGGIFQLQEFWDSVKKTLLRGPSGLPRCPEAQPRILAAFAQLWSRIPVGEGGKRSPNPVELPKSRRKIPKGSESSLKSRTEAAEGRSEAAATSREKGG